MNGEGNGTPLQYSWLENPMDGGAWWATVHGVAKSRTRLSDFTFTFHFHALEKEMATHSSVLAWRIPGTGEPGGLPSMGSHRVGHDWSDLAAAAAAAVVLAYNVLLCGIFVWFWHQGDSGLIKWVWVFSFLCNFREEFDQDRHQLFFFGRIHLWICLWSHLAVNLCFLEDFLLQFWF